MLNFIKSKQARILSLLLLLMIVLTLIDAVDMNSASAPARALTQIATPLQQAGAFVSDKCAAFFSRYSDAEAANARADALQAENDELRQQLIAMEALARENTQYKQELAIAESTEGLTTLPASVIARDALSGCTSFQIDVGEKDGVSVGNLVITSSGVVGMISKVYNRTAQVTTILDPDISIGVYLSDTGDVGSLSGDTDNETLCKIGLLPSTCAATSGSMVVTAGVGGTYPKGLLIGTLTSEVLAEDNGIEGYAYVTPAVSVDTVTNVSVVTGFTDADNSSAAESALSAAGDDTNDATDSEE